MKTKSILQATFIVAITTTLFISSCSKEKVENPIVETSTITSEQVSVSSIQKFLNLVQNQGTQLKTDKYYSTSEVFNLIGATLNYTYSFPTANVKNIKWVEQTIEIPVSSILGIRESDAISAYSSAVENVRASFRSIEKANIFLLSVLVKDLGIDGNSKLRLKLVSQIGSGINPGATGFDDTDEYFFARDTYKCDETGEEGAPNIFEQMIYFKYKTAPAPGWHVWYWPQTTYIPIYADFSCVSLENPLDNFIDYKIFFAKSSVGAITSETKCLGYNQSNSGIHEMDFYLDGADQICSSWLTSSTLNPNGYAFNNCFFIHDDSGTQIKHILNFNFGKRNAVKKDEEANNYPIAID